MSQESPLAWTSIYDTIWETAQYLTHPHSQFLMNCFKEKVSVPAKLIGQLPEEKISTTSEESNFRLISEFPQTKKQFQEFQKRV